MNVAIIPARGGSKRIPKKNIKRLGDKPIISVVIQNLINSGCFDEIVVSTDDIEVARTAREAGAITPFVRPAHLSCDHTPTLQVIQHALTFLETDEKNIDLVCCIYPTAALIQKHTIECAFKAAKLNKKGFTFSAREFSHPIQRALELKRNGSVAPREPEKLKERTQDLTAYIHDAGQFYFGHRNTWLQATSILGNASNGVFLLGQSQAVDIDTNSDWELLELIYLGLKTKARSCNS